MVTHEARSMAMVQDPTKRFDEVIRRVMNAADVLEKKVAIGAPFFASVTNKNAGIPA